MSDSERPKPQYGEYASDDEQASALVRSGVEPASVHPQALPASSVSPAAFPTQTPTIAPRPRSAFDRIVTVFLISFGAVSIFGSATSFLNLGEKLPEIVAQQNMGVFHSTDQTATIGIIIFATQVLLWSLTAVWSYRRIKRRKLAWWVPVLLGALSFVLLSILLGSALSADPSFISDLSMF